jgi:hypothetical protein
MIASLHQSTPLDYGAGNRCERYRRVRHHLHEDNPLSGCRSSVGGALILYTRIGRGNLAHEVASILRWRIKGEPELKPTIHVNPTNLAISAPPGAAPRLLDQ